jgi:hypothetical protein
MMNMTARFAVSCADWPVAPSAVVAPIASSDAAHAQRLLDIVCDGFAAAQRGKRSQRTAGQSGRSL